MELNNLIANSKTLCQEEIWKEDDICTEARQENDFKTGLTRRSSNRIGQFYLCSTAAASVDNAYTLLHHLRGL